MISKKDFVIWCLLATFVSGSPKIDAGISLQAKRDFNSILNPLIADRRLPGYYVAVFKNGQKEFEQSEGLADEKNRVAPDGMTLYAIESMTEPLTAAAIMLLVESGQLALDEPLSKYLPEFEAMKVAVNGSLSSDLIPAHQQITIRHLISHSSGLTEAKRFSSNMTEVQNLYRQEGLFRRNSSLGSLADHVKALAKIPLVFHPGARKAESISYDVLARVVEIVTGESFPEFLSEAVLEPLAMGDTHFIVPEAKRARVAAMYEPVVWGYNVPGKPKMYRASVLSTNNSAFSKKKSNSFIGGSSGLMSTGDDYAKFLSFLLGSNGNTDLILSLPSRKVILRGFRNTNEDLALVTKEIASRESPQSDGPEPGFAASDAKPSTFSYKNSRFNTSFWIDMETRIAGVFMTQLSPLQFELAPALKEAADRNFSGNQ